MKTFYPNQKVQKHYLIVGIGSVIVSIVIFFIMPLGKINNIQKIFFICLLIVMPILYVTRNKRVILTIDEDELFFNDGLLSKYRIPLNNIKSIDYHPDLRFRFNTFNKKKPIIISNLYSEEVQKDILTTIKNKRHRIKINYIEKPSKIIVKENKDSKEGKKK